VICWRRPHRECVIPLPQPRNIALCGGAASWNPPSPRSSLDTELVLFRSTSKSSCQNPARVSRITGEGLVDPRYFDQLTVVAASRRSRRTALRVLVLGAAGLGLARRGTEDAAAKGDPRCSGQLTRSNTQCPAFACAAGCVCTLTVSGTRMCLDDFAPTSCPARDQCDSNSDCWRGYACARVGGCCPDHPRRSYCLAKCPA
jgi:hypothetical protein